MREIAMGTIRRKRKLNRDKRRKELQMIPGFYFVNCYSIILLGFQGKMDLLLVNYFLCPNWYDHNINGRMISCRK